MGLEQIVLLQELQAAHDGHQQIEQYQLGVEVLELFECLFAVERGRYLMTYAL